MKKRIISLLLSFSVLSLFSCVSNNSDSGQSILFQQNEINKVVENLIEEEQTSTITSATTFLTIATSTPTTSPAVTHESFAETTIKETETATSGTESITEKADVVFPAGVPVDLSSIPDCNDTAYAEINGNKPYFDVFTDEYFEIYPELDTLGRCGTVFELIGPETMPETEREGIGMIKPSGWNTVKYPDVISDLYLYNRCHLIGFQLCGKNADERNLITGTRYMNVSGMLKFEDETASYIRRSGNHVLYRVTPVFDGSELVVRGVLMEALSVEDNGSGLCFCVFCYNVQPGIGINYADGTSWIIEEPVQTEAIEIIHVAETEEETVGQQYILNTNTKKFHYPSCYSVKQMKDKNKQEYTGTRDEIINRGYAACKNCNP